MALAVDSKIDAQTSLLLKKEVNPLTPPKRAYVVNRLPNARSEGGMRFSSPDIIFDSDTNPIQIPDFDQSYILIVGETTTSRGRWYRKASPATAQHSQHIRDISFTGSAGFDPTKDAEANLFFESIPTEEVELIIKTPEIRKVNLLSYQKLQQNNLLGINRAKPVDVVFANSIIDLSEVATD